MFHSLFNSVSYICSIWCFPYAPTFAGIFTHKTGWFLGEMLVFIFQHHGAFYVCEGLTKNISRLWESDLPCCTAVRDGALYAASQWPSLNSLKKKARFLTAKILRHQLLWHFMGTWRVHIDMFLVFPTCSFLFCQYVEVIFSAKFAETWGWFHHAKRASGGRWCWDFAIPHRIHGAGTYANIWGILMVNVTIYIYSIHGSYGY